jgi:predicted transcriptional regulator of viral defense system
MVLAEVIRRLGWQTYECTHTAADIAQQMELHPMVVSDALGLLERVGAISRIKRGRKKVIIVTPEGAYRGNIANHADAVDRYRKVVPLPRRGEDPPAAA